MKKVLVVISLTLVLGLVLVGCPDPVTPTPEPPFMPMVKVEGGSYTYQEGESNPEADTRVADFYLGETEVTQGQWEEVMGKTWPGTVDGDVPSDEFGLGDDSPVYYVSWYDAIEFCNALTRAELTENDVVYTITKTDETDHTTWTVDVDVTKKGYRLPTEKEWEYAAGWAENGERNSHAGVNITTDGDNGLGDYAWYNANTGSFGEKNQGAKIVGTAGSDTLDTAKSGNKNALGLYDMSGNVREWCYDMGSDNSSARVNRGGSWYDSSSDARVAAREESTPDHRYFIVGFRVARSVD